MRRLRSLKFVWIGLLAMCLAGCANLGKRVFDKAANEDVKTIGLIEPANDDEYEVVNEDTAAIAGAFGLIGGVAVAIDIKSKTNRFTRLVKEHNFNLVQEFQEAVARELQECGYSIKMLKRPGPQFKLMESYEGLDSGVDAYLDGRLSAGYLKKSGSPGYIPVLQVKIRLVKREPMRTLFLANYFYGLDSHFLDTEDMPSDQSYSFEDFDDLTKDPEKAAEGLSKGASEITKRIAGALSRGEQ